MTLRTAVDDRADRRASRPWPCRVLPLLSLPWLAWACSTAPSSPAEPVGAAQALGSAAVFTATFPLPLEGTPRFTLSGAQARFDAERWQRRVGEPALPLAQLTVLLPRDAKADALSVSLRGVTEVEVARGVEVEPALPPVFDGRVEWPKGRLFDHGRDLAVYARDALYPREALGDVRTGQLREFKLVTVSYFPYRHNPVTGRLVKLTAGELVVSCPRDVSVLALSGGRTPSPPSARALRTVTELAVNAGPALASYGAAYGAAYGASFGASPSGALRAAPLADGPSATYLVLTTQAIAAGSTQLASFVAAKQRRGFSVRVVTENEWGGGAGDVAAENLRRWLRAKALALGTEYVLLIGDPRPETGDVPMKLTWPRNNATTFETFRDAPTDQYYAELTGDWDVDGDGRAGEEDDDLQRQGGPDGFLELMVGRIPFYGELGDLDHILAKSIAYDADVDPSWRTRALLPMVPSDQWTPAFQLGEQVRDLVTTPNGWTVHRVYNTLNPYLSYSPIEGVPQVESMPCTEDTVAAAWKRGTYGLVLWWTHGTARAAADVVNSDGAALLSDDNERHPSFTYQSSCSNSEPEVEDNLSYALLRRGAVTTVGATRVSWYYMAQKDFAATDSAPGLGFAYAKHLVADHLSAGEALARSKAAAYSSAGLWMNFVVLNTYGDPSLRILPGSEVTPKLTCNPSYTLTNVRANTHSLFQFTCYNSGGGSLQLQGVASIQPWLRAAVEGERVVSVTIDTAGLTPLANHEATLTIDSNGGSQTVVVRFQLLREFASHFETLALAGAAFGGWSAAAPSYQLKLVRDSTWELTLNLDAPLGSSPYKVVANGRWDDHWGEGTGLDARLQYRTAANATVSLVPGEVVLRVTEGRLPTDALRAQWLFGATGWKRTVVFIGGRTRVGQDLFVRGGIDHGYARSALDRDCTVENGQCAIPIRYRGLLNATTAAWKQGDTTLDWYGSEAGQGAGAAGSALDWTTNHWDTSAGPRKTVEVDGYGETPLNQWGEHFWMLDVEMDCARTVNGWFELKSFISNGPGWEPDVAQPGAPYPSKNHFARCGYLSVFERGGRLPLAMSPLPQ